MDKNNDGYSFYPVKFSFSLFYDLLMSISLSRFISNFLQSLYLSLYLALLPLDCFLVARFIDANELYEALQLASEPITIQIAVKIIDMFDRDRNGVIDINGNSQCYYWHAVVVVMLCYC